MRNGTTVMTPDEYDRFVRSPYVAEQIATDDGVRLVIVSGRADSISSPGSLPVVVAWLGEALGADGPDAADLVVGEADLDHLVDHVERCPLAAATLVTLLRATETSGGPDEALALESAAYSMLQAGPEFASWRGTVEPEVAHDEGPLVRVDRDGAELLIELDRPHRHNAVTAQLRDDLDAALAIARLDDSVERIVLRGLGPSFCSGGDTAEFGSRADPVVAHRIRLARSPARSIHSIADRLTVHVHGATLGGGVEMAAFAGKVIAHGATRFGLPEVGLGLIPGAGGTVSLPRRIGRQRTAALALGTDTIGATTALQWGLVDEIDDTWNG